MRKFVLLRMYTGVFLIFSPPVFTQTINRNRDVVSKGKDSVKVAALRVTAEINIKRELEGLTLEEQENKVLKLSGAKALKDVRFVYDGKKGKIRRIRVRLPGYL